ncbi:hypothetical protein V1508DRAFT_397084 [Lipomyces doorenjongii]|uniref:uncharacterized protein n=1 Tax=Lipomyces doorenjongii TaxID=383834 RepID=UPI0034CE3780
MSSYADVTAKNASQTPQEVRTNSSSLMSLFSKFKRKRRRNSVGSKNSRRLGRTTKFLQSSLMSTATTHTIPFPSTSSTKSSRHSQLSPSPISATTASTSPLSRRSLNVPLRRKSTRSLHRILLVFSTKRRDSTSTSFTRAPSSGSTLSTRPNSCRHYSSITSRDADKISDYDPMNCPFVNSSPIIPTTPTPTCSQPAPLVADMTMLIRDERSLTFSLSQKSAKPVPELETTTTSIIAPTPMEPVASPPPAVAATTPAEPEKPADISSDEVFPEPEKALLPGHDAPSGGSDKGKKAKGKEYPFLVSAADSLKKFIACASNDVAAVVQRAKSELKNPVVTCNLGTWTAIIASATYYFNIKKGALPSVFTGPNGKYVTAAAITCALALTASDIVVSTKKYPKYSKK